MSFIRKQCISEIILHIITFIELPKQKYYLRQPFSSAPERSGQSLRPSHRRDISMQLPLSQRNCPDGQTTPAEEKALCY